MTGPEPTFERVEALSLYRLSSTAEAAAPGFWAGYRPGDQATFERSPTLAGAWQDRGTYVFLGRAPAEMAAFSAQLGEIVGGGEGGPARAIWIDDPTLPLGNWQFVTLDAGATGSGAGIAWEVTRPAIFAVGEYAVELAAGTPLTEADPGAFGWGIAAGRLTFSGPAGDWQSTPTGAWIPLDGATLGCWRAGLTLPAVEGDGLAALGVLIRYAAPRRDGEDGDAVEMLEMPVLAQYGEDIDLHLAFDWLNPVDPGRTRLGFFADEGDGAGDGSVPAVAPLTATLRTSRGYETTLEPRAHGAPLRPAGLVLCRTPAAVDADPRASTFSYHLAPDGGFDLAVALPAESGTDRRHRLMFGLSGLEYAELSAGVEAEAVVHFAAGMPAFAPAAAPHAEPVKPDTVAPLTDRATTAHLTILPPQPGPGLRYYAQPRQAPLYAAGDLGGGFLDYLELPAARLPEWTAGAAEAPATVPAAPLAGVAAGDGALARRIEEAALAPARRQAIGLAPAGLGAAAEDGTPAVTPQGLLVEAGSEDIERVVVASLPASPASQVDLTQLALTKVGRELRGAIQASELFFVVGEPEAYMADSSVPYRLDAVGLIVARSLGVPEATIEALRPVVMPGGVPREFGSEPEFDAAVGAIAGDRLGTLHETAGFLRAVLSGWTFQLSPRSWRREEAPTIMLFKFCNRPLSDLIEDGGAWGWSGMPEAAASQAELRRIAAAARARAESKSAPADDPYAAFHRDVLDNPDWNGVLFLNAPISISELPPELQFLAAGISADRFYAHHLGFSASPVEVEGDEIAIRRTAAFGLVDYRDSADLVLSSSVPADFDFKTLSLTARFENATLVDFHARVELMVNRLLGAPLTKLEPTHGNNMILTGSSQRQGGNLSYAFVLEGDHRYAADRTVLDSVEVDALQLLTTAGAEGAGTVVTTFALGGFLRFVDSPEFDPFGYGPAAAGPGPEQEDGRLRFDGLGVEMRFPLGASEIRSFAVSLDGIRLDTSRSHARRRSLVRNFPVALSGLASSLAQAPQDLGFDSISAPLDQSPLRPPWYGLTYTLDLGTLGALAGSTGLSLTLLVAWGAGAEVGSRPAYIGMRLPGGMQWSLQSVIKLGFRSFQFSTEEGDGGELAYILRLRRFALSLLGISLPPGNLDITLFGDSKHPESRTVGWYAAYEEEAEKQARLGERV